MKRHLEELLSWLIILSAFIFVVIVAMSLVKEFVGEQYISGILAFFGSIIGGLITFLGVKYTVKFELKRDRKNKLPKLINDLWKIRKNLSYVSSFIHVIKENAITSDVQMMDDYYKNNEEWITELAATIDPEVYSVVNKIFTLVSDYYSYKSKEKLNEWETKGWEYLSVIDQKIQQFEHEYKIN
jgi:hypothetical protein